MLGLNRSTFYYEPRPESVENLGFMRLIDEQYLQTPFYGARRMCHYLKTIGYEVNRKRVVRLMRLMGIEALYPRPRTTVTDKEHKKYPYLLRSVAIVRPNQVWATDITYIPLRYGFLYLVAVIDWYSRYVLAWELSSSLDSSFCESALRAALSRGTPDIFNSDQGSQFTSQSFTGILLAAGVAISMDGVGRALDNIIVERFWWSLKYEDIYIRGYETGAAIHQGIHRYMEFFNNERPHSSHGNRTPAEVYFGQQSVAVPRRQKLFAQAL